jgi:hypothetical protein
VNLGTTACIVVGTGPVVADPKTIANTSLLKIRLATAQWKKLAPGAKICKSYIDINERTVCKINNVSYFTNFRLVPGEEDRFLPGSNVAGLSEDPGPIGSSRVEPTAPGQDLSEL